QQLAQDVRYLQWKEAEAATESLLKSRESAVERYRYYRRLLGAGHEYVKEIAEFSLGRQELTEENFDEVYAELVGQYAQESARMEYPSLTVIDEGRLYLNPNEYAELGDLLPLARDYQSLAFALREIAPSMALIPDFPINLHYLGLGGMIVFGGTALTSNMQTAADIFDHLASRAAQDASIAAKTASYERRADEWMFQSNLAARELVQIGRQIISSLIREQITRLEYENLKAQIEQAEELKQFLEAKLTGEAFYNWMQGELSKLYYEYYKFAFDIARRAEQTMKHELMRPELDELAFIKFNYWDGGRKGLLSGEALHLDLKRMEMAYHDHNKREYELTKHVSLRQLNPSALLGLKATGACEVTLPEWLFDLDGPGHYMRRIKNVSVSIPSVTGPYTSVNCTLSLLRSTIRKSALLADGKYGRQGREDGRFVDYYGTIESVVTSSGNNDSGMF
ncbi:MAG: toxin, partial [Anaerolineae bacterium]|nr:toxin [Anaerolineae bacterium]